MYFKLNGTERQVSVRDASVGDAIAELRKADRGKPGEVGAPMPGTVIDIHCTEGQEVAAGDPLLTLEAMKMETVVRAPVDGTVVQLFADPKGTVQSEELLVVLD